MVMVLVLFVGQERRQQWAYLCFIGDPFSSARACSGTLYVELSYRGLLFCRVNTYFFFCAFRGTKLVLLNW